MKVWLIGASRIGTEILRQLQKNEEIEVVVSDSSPRPLAVREGVIEKLDYIETVTPVNVNSLARRLYPDLILVDSGAESRNIGRMTGGSELSQALTYEIAATSDFPCLVL
jgi:hypothetical protein